MFLVELSLTIWQTASPRKNKLGISASRNPGYNAVMDELNRLSLPASTAWHSVQHIWTTVKYHLNLEGLTSRYSERRLRTRVR